MTCIRGLKRLVYTCSFGSEGSEGREAILESGVTNEVHVTGSTRINGLHVRWNKVDLLLEFRLGVVELVS